jgi:hypothetical protein
MRSLIFRTSRFMRPASQNCSCQPFDLLAAFGLRWANAFWAYSSTSLPCCLSDSNSEGVSCSETNEVSGFLGCEGDGCRTEVPRFPPSLPGLTRQSISSQEF